ncbi:DUF3488 and transglutaminase-like domain-containing protein [Herbiconiux sp. L3-i23]|uniref:transglutaminase family protein n=1 Tax=Herbiconiux sp. L3-i23 TaxID=2905871 RepID=UPI00206A76D5|nr:DUF3488 and transglutaminase-like domain-containing protein [Herbiconiux sp. L3-i23]BDI23781.1 transglutaminase [Herbiconiux sp. L3-i23]
MSERNHDTRRATPTPGAGVTAAALVATLAGAGNLGAVASGSSWWWLSALAGAVGLAAAALVRRRLRFWLVPLAAAVVASGLTIVVLFAPSTLAFGVIPTGDTIERLRQLVGEAVAHIAAESMPAVQNDGLDLVLVAGIVAVAILVETIAVSARRPLLAGIPLLVLAIVPGRAASEEPELFGITVTIAAVLLMIWLDRQRLAARPPVVAALAVTALAVTGGVVGQALAPAFEESTASGTTLRPVFASGAEPLVRLGDHLRRGADVTALRYTTSASDPIYLRVVVIDDLTGEEWRTTPLEETLPGDRPLASFPAPPGLADEVERTEVVTQIDDSFAERRWLPLPYPAVGVTDLGDEGEWAWDPQSLAAGTIGDPRRTGEFEVTSLELVPTADQLRSAPPSSGLERYLQLPDDVPAIIGETAVAVTEGLSTDYDRALALQRYLRSSEFRYDEDTPEEADGDGDSFDVISTFLTDKSGYCVHFASAMTVMARELGIPARIAVGYQPGERQIDDPTTFEVTSHDLHAWPELYFEGAGWTRFEPTPGRGDVPAYTSNTRPQTEEEAAPSPAPTSTSTAAARDENLDSGATPGTDTGVGMGLGVLIPVGVVALLAVPAVVRLLRTRRRLVLLGRGSPSAGWDELHDTAVDLGLATSGLTPRMLAELVSSNVVLDADAAAALVRWRAATERARFARDATVDAGVTRAEATSILRALRRSRTRFTRVVARVAPRSLVPTIRIGRVGTSARA